MWMGLFLMALKDVCPLIIMGDLLGVVPLVRTQTGLVDGLIFEFEESWSDSSQFLLRPPP